MKILTLREQEQHLEQWKLPARPDTEKECWSRFLIQFFPPKELRAINCFIAEFLAVSGEEGEVMMTVGDTENPEDYELKVFQRLRLSNGEKRSIWEAPAHLFSAGEFDELIPMFGLTVAFGWEAYLYLPRSRTILLNWEGDIFDLWTDDRGLFEKASEIRTAFGLQTVTEPNKPGEGTA